MSRRADFRFCSLCLARDAVPATVRLGAFVRRGRQRHEITLNAVCDRCANKLIGESAIYDVPLQRLAVARTRERGMAAPEAGN